MAQNSHADDRDEAEFEDYKMTDDPLTVGDMVQTEGPTTGTRTLVVTRREEFHEESAPRIGPNEFGYLRADESEIIAGHVQGVSHVHNVERVARGNYLDDVQDDESEDDGQNQRILFECGREIVDDSDRTECPDCGEPVLETWTEEA